MASIKSEDSVRSRRVLCWTRSVGLNVVGGMVRQILVLVLVRMTMQVVVSPVQAETRTINA